MHHMLQYVSRGISVLTILLFFFTSVMLCFFSYLLVIIVLHIYIFIYFLKSSVVHLKVNEINLFLINKF